MCPEFGVEMRGIAIIDDPNEIKRILRRLANRRLLLRCTCSRSSDTRRITGNSMRCSERFTAFLNISEKQLLHKQLC